LRDPKEEESHQPLKRNVGGGGRTNPIPSETGEKGKTRECTSVTRARERKDTWPNRKRGRFGPEKEAHPTSERGGGQIPDPAAGGGGGGKKRSRLGRR